MAFRVSFKFRWGFIYGFFRVHLGFHVGVSYQDFFGCHLHLGFL